MTRKIVFIIIFFYIILPVKTNAYEMILYDIDNYSVSPVYSVTEEIPISYILNPYIYIDYVNLIGIENRSKKMYEGNISYINGRSIIVKKSKCDPVHFFDLELVKNRSLSFLGRNDLFSKIRDYYPDCATCMGDECEKKCYDIFSQDCLCPYIKGFYNYSPITSSCAIIPRKNNNIPVFCTVTREPISVRILPSKISNFFNPSIKIILKHGSEIIDHEISTNTFKNEKVFFKGKWFVIDVEFNSKNNIICAKVNSDISTNKICFDVPSMITPDDLSLLKENNSYRNIVEFTVKELDTTFTLGEGENNYKINLEVLSPKIEGLNFVPKIRTSTVLSYEEDPDSHLLCLNMLNRRKDNYLFRYIDERQRLQEMKFLSLDKAFVPVILDKKNNIWNIDYYNYKPKYINRMTQEYIDNIYNVGKLDDIFTMQDNTGFRYYRYEPVLYFLQVKNYDYEVIKSSMLIDKSQFHQFGIVSSESSVYVLPVSHIEEKTGRLWHINNNMQAINAWDFPSVVILPVTYIDPLSQGLCVEKNFTFRFSEITEDVKNINRMCKKFKIIVYESGTDASVQFLNNKRIYKYGRPGTYKEVIFTIDDRYSDFIFNRGSNGKDTEIKICGDNCCMLMPFLEDYEELGNCNNYLEELFYSQYSWEDYVNEHDLKSDIIGLPIIEPAENSIGEIYRIIDPIYSDCHSVKRSFSMLENKIPGSGGCYNREYDIFQKGGDTAIYIKCLEYIN
ncbi:MAG: hypothetical protein P857_1005 [Candidatus Xenolissoclinum pacificiensis L6]|uniref:Uncharacterized protein n=1 Tax=Candidatus Xenolissoclinum pacificiensis L6 TaxID=1401685 RepID=W2V2E8_9RICK|nr:MAG: hypothetical protein P857_1005 [Candidatus Xenolissoclinum pacificiensis L6]